ncbi:MAG TPA: SURF1 family protein [Methylocella sp.]|nr:SURF1 family protein [Methylocella sp.]
MPRHKARLIGPAIFTGVAAAILVSLGLWQLHRLAWKEGLIAEIEARANAAPQPLPPVAEWPKLRPQDYEYRHVTAEGVFENGKQALVFRASGGAAGLQPGYQVMTPLQLTSGGTVIVNRGFVPLERKDQATRLAGLIQGETQVTGLMRQPETRNFFTPADNPAAGTYYTRDPGLIAKQFGLASAAPFLIDADAIPVPGGWPKGGATERNLPNNHFSYALTWFGLALALLGVFTAFVWQKRQ